MIFDELDAIIADTECTIGGIRWTALWGSMGSGFYVQLAYSEPDVLTGQPAEQKGRKWYLSKHATKSEVVQTILKAAITSSEHMVREHFKYRGVAVFNPHFDVEDLVDLAQHSCEVRGSVATR